MRGRGILAITDVLLVPSFVEGETELAISGTCFHLPIEELLRLQCTIHMGGRPMVCFLRHSFRKTEVKRRESNCLKGSE